MYSPDTHPVECRKCGCRHVMRTDVWPAGFGQPVGQRRRVTGIANGYTSRKARVRAKARLRLPLSSRAKPSQRHRPSRLIHATRPPYKHVPASVTRTPAAPGQVGALPGAPFTGAPSWPNADVVDADTRSRCASCPAAVDACSAGTAATSTPLRPRPPWPTSRTRTRPRRASDAGEPSRASRERHAHQHHDPSPPPPSDPSTPHARAVRMVW